MFKPVSTEGAISYFQSKILGSLGKHEVLDECGELCYNFGNFYFVNSRAKFS